MECVAAALVALVALVAVIAVAGCSKSGDAQKAVADLDAACAKVADLRAQIDSLHLDRKGQEAMSDPRVDKVLQQASEATAELVRTADVAAKKNQGRLGQLRHDFETNKELIGKVGAFIVSESIDDARDKARKFREVADIVGADACT